MKTHSRLGRRGHRRIAVAFVDALRRSKRCRVVMRGQLGREGESLLGAVGPAALCGEPEELWLTPRG